MTQKNRKKKATSTPSRDRVVYEIKGPNIGTQRVDAATTAELKKLLAPLGLDPYSTQAAAHLAHVERAAVQGKAWSIKRLGVLAFVADTDDKPAQRRPAAQTPTAPSDGDGGVDGQPQTDERPEQPRPAEPSPLEGQGA